MKGIPTSFTLPEEGRRSDGTRAVRSRRHERGRVAGVSGSGSGHPPPHQRGRRTEWADWQVYHRILESGLSGPEFATLTEELAKYAYPVVRAWLASGEMFARCAAQGRRLGPVPSDWSRDDVTELALETVAKALQAFRRSAALGRGWHPDRGAALTTYVTGACVREFPNVYRRWLRERRRWGVVEFPGDLPEQGDRGAGDPQDVVVGRLAAEQLFGNASPITRAVLWLTTDGRTQAEIAELLGMTRRAVEGVLYRHRRRTARDGGR